MNIEVIPKTYELAYHLSPDLEEKEVKGGVEDLEKLIAQNGGSVVVSKEPDKRHLSYPIKHKQQAYFGVMDFIISPEKIDKVNSQMKLISNVMRYLLIQKPAEGKTLSLAIESKATRLKSKEGKETTVAGNKETIQPKVSEEKITEELEDVLEKL